MSLKDFKKQDLNELWSELGNWFKGKGYKSDDELAADKKGSGERSFKFKKGDIAKGEKIAKQKRMAAADASLDKGTQTPDFGQQQIAKRDASWDKGIDNPQQSTQVARPKPPVKSYYDDRIMRAQRNKQAQVAKPKPPVKSTSNYDDRIMRGQRINKADAKARLMKKHGPSIAKRHAGVSTGF